MRCSRRQITLSGSFFIICALFITLLFPPVTAAAKCTIILKNSALVSGEYVRLSDIASKYPDSLSGIKLTEAPPINSQITITKRLLANILKTDVQGICGNYVTVKRKRFLITEEFVKKLARPLPIKIITTMPIALPFAHYSVKLHTRKLSNGFLWLELRIFKNGRFYRNIGVSAKLISHRIIPVAAHYIRKGQIIHKSDITYKKTDSPASAYYLTGISAILGRVALTDIKKGSPFKRCDIKLMPYVNRGDIVTVTVKDGSIRITTVAKALKSGFSEDIIPIMYLNSKRIVTATVVGRKEVEVR